MLTPENPCAFPVAAVYDAVREQVNASTAYGCDAGMSLRDYFASRAPQMTDQWWKDSESSGEHWIDVQAAFAYAYADAMLKARLK